MTLPSNCFDSFCESPTCRESISRSRYDTTMNEVRPCITLPENFPSRIWLGSSSEIIGCLIIRVVALSAPQQSLERGWLPFKSGRPPLMLWSMLENDNGRLDEHEETRFWRRDAGRHC